MKTALIVHGAYGNPQENWFLWLKEKLKDKYEVIVPKFPTPLNQTLEKWMVVYESYSEKIANDSIFIGHSLGVAFLLRILEKQEITAAFFVAGVGGKVNNQFWEGMRSFAEKKFDWEKIKRNCEEFHIYHSNDDPYIPLKHAELLAQHLSTDLTFIKDAGHLNSDSGYTTFPKLLEDIKSTAAKHL